VRGIAPNLTWFWAHPVFFKEASNFAGLACLLGIKRRITRLLIFCQFKKTMVENNDGKKPPNYVTPVKTGVQKSLEGLDSCFRRNDNMEIGFEF
jgi:hypothetical protein